MLYSCINQLAYLFTPYYFSTTAVVYWIIQVIACIAAAAFVYA